MFGLRLGFKPSLNMGDTGLITDSSVTSINAEGWSASYTSPPTFDPVSNPKYVVASRSGFDTSGNSNSVSEALTITQRVRQAYPNQASLDTSRVALTDYVYSTDTISGVTNNSAETSPKPIANWVLPDHGVVGNSLHLEVVAFHRNARNREQIACVKFIATDGVNTVTQVVGTSTVLGHGGDVFPVVGYACDLNITTLTAGAITANAEVYPWIGGAASVLKSVDSAVAREFSPRTYLKNTTLAASPVFAYVNTSTGNDTTGAVSSTAATAEATPCLTIAGAINRIVAVNGSVDGCVLRLMAGTHAFTTSAIATTRTQTTGELVITRDPNATRANAILTFGVTAASRPRLGAAGGWLRFSDITITRTGTLTLQGEAASPLRIWFDRVNFNNASNNAAIFSNSDGVVTGMTLTNSSSSLVGAATREWRMWRGLTATLAATSIESWLVLGSNITTPGQLSRGSRTASGAIIAFNRVTSPDTATPMTDFAVSESVTGLAFVQNVIEFTSATSAHTLRVTGDAATGNATHFVIHNNTIAGFFNNGRSNLFYEDGATARTSKLQSVVGNIHVQLNTKGDVFMTSGARVGNWAYLYGVGCRAEFSQFIDANSGGLGTSFAQAYPGLGASIGTSNSVRNDPLFTSYAGTTSGPTVGAGGGTYTIQSGSPAKSRNTNPVLRFDLSGATRPSTGDSSGAYV